MTAINLYVTFLDIVVLVIALSHLHGFFAVRGSYYRTVAGSTIAVFSAVVAVCAPLSIVAVWLGAGPLGALLGLPGLALIVVSALPPLRATSNALLDASSKSLTKWRTARRARRSQ